ncbi:MAG TPA: OsmC family protein [Rhizomicrobium sp.]|nr:OsmC family protein [Rhizomicrobium sp.]
MAHAKADIGQTQYATTIEAGGHRIIADEPPSNGGADAGPAPYDLLVAALSACTAITLKMYANHKGWPLTACHVGVSFIRTPDKVERIERTLKLEGDLTDEQRARIADIAERTPVTLTLKKGLAITTTLL